MTTQEILEAARGIITPRKKWMKGDLNDGHGRYCAIGAIESAARRKKANYKDIRKAVLALEAVVPAANVPMYNDAPSTTHECVLAAFDAAAEKEEKCQPSA